MCTRSRSTSPTGPRSRRFPISYPAELNGVVNNAGIIVNGPVEGLSLDDL